MAYENYYDTGSISVDSGSTTVTGHGTAWQTWGVNGGLLVANDFSTLVPIASVEDEDALTLREPWPASTLATADYFIWLVPAEVSNTIYASQVLADMANRLSAGSYADIFDGFASGDIAERDQYDESPQSFAFLQTSPLPFQLWVKGSDADGDWDGPSAYGQGEAGQDADLASILEAAEPTVGADDATLSFSLEDGNNLFHSFTIAGSRELGVPIGIPNAGVTFNVEIKQDVVGGRALTFDAAYEFPSGVTPSIATTTNGETLFAVLVRSISPTRLWLHKVGQDYS